MLQTKDKKENKGTRTIFWWVIWITATIVAFFVSTAIWSPIIAEHFGTVRNSKTAAIWVTAVFGTWMVILVPLIVVMYQKVDKVYEDARLNREKKEREFRSIVVAPEKRRIPDDLKAKLDGIPETIQGGHLVTLTLKDGRTIPHAFIANQSEVLGIYDETEMTFETKDIANIEVNQFDKPIQFFTNNWLRLDGVTHD